MRLTIRYPSSPADAKYYTTDRLRGEFVIESLFEAVGVALIR